MTGAETDAAGGGTRKAHERARHVPATLVFGWGNPSRGDDALGPLAIEAIEALQRPDVECLTDFQLQVEHALDLQGRQRVLFIDASSSAPAPFAVSPLEGRADASYTTHEMSPEAVLHVYGSVLGTPPPPALLLAVRGDAWELGTDPSPQALVNLTAALEWARDWLDEPGSGQAAGDVAGGGVAGVVPDGAPDGERR